VVPHRRCRPHSHHRNKPEIVLLDLGLPDLDGVDLARTIRRDNPEILLVILTARSDEIDVIVGLDAGADDYLVKPFSLTVLIARLRAHQSWRRSAAMSDRAGAVHRAHDSKADRQDREVR
jgi:DNA-binding response OmpR family regulator